MNKKVKVIIILYTIQFFISSCLTCGVEPEIFEVSYESVVFKSAIVSSEQYQGFIELETNDSINKRDLILVADMITKSKQIAFQKSNLNLSSFGFSTIMAGACDPDEYIYVNPIDSFEVIVTDIETSEELEITDDIYIELPNEKRINIKDWKNSYNYELRSDSHSFMLSIGKKDSQSNELENIPTSALFTIKVYLQSGKLLVSTTQEVNFYKD